MKILFSIIIPTYNRADLVSRAVKSALNQNYDTFEIIVVDDGSTDNTEREVKRLSNPKLRYYKTNNQERAAARNFGVSKSKGEYITFLDSDDILYDHHLTSAESFIYDKNMPEIFHLGYEILDENGNSFKKINKKPATLNKSLIKYGNKLSCIGVFIKQEIARQYPFIESRELSGTEDIELWMRLGSRYTIYSSNQITSAMHQHDVRSVMEKDPKKLIRRVTLYLKYLFDDETNAARYSKYKRMLFANSYSYISLHLALMNEKKLAFNYLLKSINQNPYKVFSVRFLAIVKCLILK